MTTTPLVSVVIPCRNERRSIAACLDSLLHQDLPRDQYEVLMVDGRSTDGCEEIARARGVRIVHDTLGKGPAAARNLGIREARGDVIAFTDADCVPARDWLSSILDVFRRDPGLTGVAGALRMPTRTLIGRLEDLDALANYRGVITSNVAYRKRALVEVGGFDERLQCAEDYDLAWRLIDAGHRIAHDRRPVVLHDPPEVSGTLAQYLRKQAWYARHDLPTYALAMRRASKGDAPGSRSAVDGLRSAAKNAALTTLACAGVASRTLGIGALGATAWRSARQVRRMGASGRELPAMVGVATLASLARGAGTLAGLADLALRPSGRALLSARGRAAPRSLARGAPS